MSYADCVVSLRTSLSFLDAAVATLDTPPDRADRPAGAVADFPRLQHVFSSLRHYELIPQPALAAAEASLQNEIGPAVASLLDRAEHQLARQARRIDTLQARAALLGGRLEGVATDKTKTKTAKAKATAARVSTTSTDPLRLRMMRQRREQLKYSLGRLEREVAQKERELRQQLQVTM